MPSPETRAITEVEVSSPAPDPTTETEQKLESKPEESREYDPTAEQVTKTWEVLGLMNDQLPGEDPKLEFIASLSADQKRYFEAVKRQKATYEAKKNPAGQKKLARIFVLRKLVLGHDERAGETVEQAYGYLNVRISRTARKLQNLLVQRPRTLTIQQGIDRQQRSLRWLSEQRKNMGWLMASGYPELWDKIRETIQSPTDEENPNDNGLSPEEIEELAKLMQGMRSGEQGASSAPEGGEPDEPEQEAGPEETVESEISPEEKTRRERLTQVIAPELGRHQEVAPEVVELLSEWGFNSVETVIQKQEKGQTVDYIRTTIFVDPQNPRLQEELRRVLTRSTLENGEKRFATALKQLATEPEIPFLVKTAIGQLTNNYRLPFPERQDAEAVLQFLNAREPKPYAMFTQASASDRRNLVSIEATSKRLLYHYQASNKVPEYHDNTVFFASPALTFETKASEFQN